MKRNRYFLKNNFSQIYVLFFFRSASEKLERTIDKGVTKIFLEDGTCVKWDEDLLDEEIVPRGSTLILRTTWYKNKEGYTCLEKADEDTKGQQGT